MSANTNKTPADHLHLLTARLDAYRAALVDSHRRHVGAVEHLTTLLGAAVLAAGGEPLTLSADLIDSAQVLGLVDFRQSDDGDMTLFFPPDADERAAGITAPTGVVAEPAAQAV